MKNETLEAVSEKALIVSQNGDTISRGRASSSGQNWWEMSDGNTFLFSDVFGIQKMPGFNIVSVKI